MKDQETLKGHERQPTFQELTLFEKVAELTTIVKKQLKKKPILYIVILGAAITRLLAVLFSTYLILWINVHFMASDNMSEEEVQEMND